MDRERFAPFPPALFIPSLISSPRDPLNPPRLLVPRHRPFSISLGYPRFQGRPFATLYPRALPFFAQFIFFPLFFENFPQLWFLPFCSDPLLKFHQSRIWNTTIVIFANDFRMVEVFMKNFTVIFKTHERLVIKKKKLLNYSTGNRIIGLKKIALWRGVHWSRFWFYFRARLRYFN